MRFDLCVPALNEADIITPTIAALKEVLDALPIDACLTIVDSASHDDTAAIARAAGAETLIMTERGKGAAVVAAAQASDAEYFGFIDADLSADPHDISVLLAPLLEGACDIAVGSRLLDANIVERESVRTFSSQIFNAMRRVSLGIRIKDTQCGLKLMNERGRRALAASREKGWFFDMEFLARAEWEKLRVREIAVHWNEHRYPRRKSRLRMIRDGFGAIAAMLRIRRRLRFSHHG